MRDGWTLNVLGPVELRCGATVLAVSGGRARTLLLCLLANDGRAPSEALVEALWGPSPPSGARATLKSHAAHLRAVLRQSGADLHGHHGAYELALGPVKLDVTTFELLCAEARRLAPADALRHLERALALWRGAAFADARDEPFAIATVARLDELRLQAVEMASAAKLALGRHDEVITDIESLVRDHPLRETLRGQPMLALYRSGRQADALRAYCELRTTLRDELGVDPSPELQQLELAILGQRADLTAPVRSEERRTAAPLPAPVGPLIGRVADVADVVDSLEDRRRQRCHRPGSGRGGLRRPRRSAFGSSGRPTRRIGRRRSCSRRSRRPGRAARRLARHRRGAAGRRRLRARCPRGRRGRGAAPPPLPSPAGARHEPRAPRRAGRDGVDGATAARTRVSRLRRGSSAGVVAVRRAGDCRPTLLPIAT